MTKKKKISIALSSFIIFISLSFFVAGEVQTAINKNIFGDTDQDGLSDSEETAYGTNASDPDSDNDGYSDGVEVKSGYDPLKPAPGDRITSPLSNKNEGGQTEGLTESVSEAISKFISSKEAGQSVSINEINDLVSGSIGDKIGPTINFDTLPKIDSATLKIKKQDYKDLSDEKRKEKLTEDKNKYISDILYLLFTNSPKVISSTGDFDAFKKEFQENLVSLSSDKPNYDYFRNFASKLDTGVKQAEEVEVPESFVEIHVKLLQLVNGYLTLRDPSLPKMEDPATRIIIMSRAKMLLELTGDFMKEVDAAFDQLN